LSGSFPVSKSGGVEYESGGNDKNDHIMNGAKVSQGPVTLPSGAVYEGEWRSEQREGFGR